MNICIIGNSHIGSLVRAWNDYLKSSFKGVDITFFGCPSNGLKGLTKKGTQLVPEDDELRQVLTYVSNGEGCIDLLKYDAFLVYGLNAKPFFLDGKYYSEAVIDAVVSDLCKRTLSLKIIELIRDAVESDIYVAHNPLHAVKQGAEATNENIFAYAKGVELLNERFYTGINARLIPQPAQTIACTGTNTLMKYSIGSRRLDFDPSHESQERLHPENDYGHMNDEFGKVWLSSFLRQIT